MASIAFKCKAQAGWLAVAMTAFGAASVQADALERIELSVESPIIVSQGGISVTDADVAAFLRERVPAEDVPVLLSSAERIGSLLSNLVRLKAMHQRAEEAGILDSAENQALLYRAVMAQSARLYREHFTRQTELDSYEPLARELYLSRPENFRKPARVDLQHLLVAADGQRTEVEAMQRILDLHKRLVAGEDFVDVASEYSDDPTFSDNDGVLAGVNPDELVGPVRSVVRETPLDQWSEPVRSEFGWHLVRPVRRLDGDIMSWEEARPLAEQRAREQHLGTAFERLLRQVQSEPAEFTEGAIQRLLDAHNVVNGGQLAEPDMVTPAALD